MTQKWEYLVIVLTFPLWLLPLLLEPNTLLRYAFEEIRVLYVGFIMGLFMALLTSGVRGRSLSLETTSSELKGVGVGERESIYPANLETSKAHISVEGPVAPSWAFLHDVNEPEKIQNAHEQKHQ